jgi:putative membrane protein
MISYLIFILKGIAMGAANVIPGVSGGTMALITGIFERLIFAFKSFNLKAVKLLFSLKLKEFIVHIDLYFLLAVFTGIALAILSLARLFDYLFTNYPVYIWAYFFGLVMASVYFVGKTIDKWRLSVIIAFIIGTAIAVIISLLSPASENSNVFYLFVCGIVAICSMILPGISGSFILILMGNYKLVMIEAVNNLSPDILFPVGSGAIIGLLAFSHILSWVFKRYRDQTISLLTGFILGSLSVLWPWQRMIYLRDALGELILKKGEPIVMKFEKVIPETFNMQVIIAIIFAITGIITIWAVEKIAVKKS